MKKCAVCNGTFDNNAKTGEAAHLCADCIAALNQRNEAGNFAKWQDMQLYCGRVPLGNEHKPAFLEKMESYVPVEIGVVIPPNALRLWFLPYLGVVEERDGRHIFAFVPKDG